MTSEESLARLGELDALFNNGRYRECLAGVRELLEDGADAATMMLIGHCHFMLEEYAEARGWFEKASADFPEQPDIHNLLGRTLERLGDEEGAVRELTEALRHSNDHRESIIHRARILLHLRRYEEALKDAARYTRGDPSKVEAWLYRGIAEMGLDRPREAEESYAQAVKLDPARKAEVDALREAYRQDKG